ncbi:MAG TPA: hypothetical protein PKM16_10195 [Bacteroidia bacterium]|nr:hypothetical protein [Bacteroidia bacterium]
MKNYTQHIVSLGLIIGLWFCSLMNANAQNQKWLSVAYVNSEIELGQSDIVSNVLQVQNNSDRQIVFSIDHSVPKDWKVIANTDKWYEINPSDTLYIPVRLIPSRKRQGGTRFVSNTFFYSAEGIEIDQTYFSCITKKIVSWDLTVNPSEVIYLPNGENEMDFSLSLHNNGNEAQDILLNLNTHGNHILLMDSAGQKLQHNYYTLKLNPDEDSLFYFKTRYLQAERNFKKIDVENYRPSGGMEERKFNIYATSSEQQKGKGSRYQKNKKITFVKLSNEKKVNEYATQVLPLSVETNMHNILGIQPIMSTAARGYTALSNGANLSYSGRIDLSTYQFNRNVLDDSYYFLGYFHRKGDVQFGNIGNGGGWGGVPVSGRGVSGHYNISERHRAGAFYTNNPGFFRSKDRTAFGVNYQLTFPNKRFFMAQYGRLLNHRQRVNTDYYSARMSFSPFKMHGLGIGASYTNSVFSPINQNEFKRDGYMLSGNYSGAYLNNTLRSTLGASYFSRNYGGGDRERLMAAFRSTYYSDKWLIHAFSNYDRYQDYIIDTTSSTLIYNSININQLFFSRNTNIGRIMPGLFYNISDINLLNVHSRGLSFNYQYFNMPENLRVSTYVKGGYNQLTDYPSIKDYFVLQSYLLVQYRNKSMNLRYSYGPQSVTSPSSLTYFNKYPQLLALSYQQQHMFSDYRFVLQNNISYSYYNLWTSHTFSYFPELYYFTPTGWRFKINAGYTLNISQSRVAGENQAIVNNPADVKSSINQSVVLGFGIKKDFGIPIPKRWSKKRFTSVRYRSFLDQNGNGVQDKNEVGVDNVVIRLNEHEVISNQNGTASYINLPIGKYASSARPIEQLDAWFPIMPDSVFISDSISELNIPLVKGIKLEGAIVIDREKMGAGADVALDLSRILVTLRDSSTKVYQTLTQLDGSFSIYVPHGTYTISLDESLFGEQFKVGANDEVLLLNEGADAYYHSFYVFERKRKIIRKKFNSDGTQE